MRVNFDPAANIILDGLRLGSIYITDARTKNITVRNSAIPGQTTLRAGELGDTDILFDNNVHGAWNKCDGCPEGRVFLPNRREDMQIGVTIQNSRFGPAATATASPTAPTACASSTTNSRASRWKGDERTPIPSSSTGPRTRSSGATGSTTSPSESWRPTAPIRK